MLILTRKTDQGARLYDSDGRFVGRVLVLGFERDRVKLGFDVDSRFVVLRDELLPSSGDSGAVPPTARSEAGQTFSDSRPIGAGVSSAFQVEGKEEARMYEPKPEEPAPTP